MHDKRASWPIGDRSHPSLLFSDCFTVIENGDPEVKP
jgi:hypothetical protein